MLTLQELVNYTEYLNIDIFEGCSVPAPFNMDLVKDNIMRRCGLMTPIYGEPEVFKALTKMWFDSNQWNFEHLAKVYLAEYSPIENVYESDYWKDEKGGKDTLTHGETHTLSGTDTFTHGETHTLSGTDTFTHGETHTLSGTDTLTHGETHTLSGTDTLTHGETHTLSGTDTLTHGETHTLSGTDTNNNTISTEHTVSAFDSGTYQPDSKDQNGGYTNTQYGKVDTASGQDSTGYGKTDTASGQDSTGYGKVDTASGQDSTGYGKVDTASGQDSTGYGKVDTASGQDSTGYGKVDTASGSDLTEYNNTLTHTRLRHGNIGVTTNNQLINEELDMLKKFNPYDWIAAKFENDNFLQLY